MHCNRCIGNQQVYEPAEADRAENADRSHRVVARMERDLVDRTLSRMPLTLRGEPHASCHVNYVLIPLHSLVSFSC
jgi:hypothetical protein